MNLEYTYKGGGENMANTKKIKYDIELYEQIKNDLLTQLELNGVIGKQYENMIEDYMQFWIAKNLLQKDIETRGVTTKYNNGGGQSGYKKNDSIAELVKVNAQMLKIISELGLKPIREGKPNEPKPTEEDYY